MTIVNRTPHPISILNGDGNVVRVFESEGDPIRLAARTVEAGEIDGVRTTRTEFGQVEGLPEETEGVFFIVSQLVKSALPDRGDLLVPAEVVRDSDGHIVGCRSLGR